MLLTLISSPQFGREETLNLLLFKSLPLFFPMFRFKSKPPSPERGLNVDPALWTTDECAYWFHSKSVYLGPLHTPHITRLFDDPLVFLFCETPRNQATAAEIFRSRGLDGEDLLAADDRFLLSMGVPAGDVRLFHSSCLNLTET